MTDIVPHKPKHPAYRVWLSVPAEERQERIDVVLRRYLADESIEQIATSFGMSRSALAMALMEYAEEDWRNIQTARAVARLEKANDELESAPDGLALARARERVKSAQWELERLCRRLYGQDAPPNMAAIQISINLRTPQAQAIDSAATLTESDSVSVAQSSSVPAE